MYFALQKLEVVVCDSQLTGKPEVGRLMYPVGRLTPDASVSAWLKLERGPGRERGEGELLFDLTYKVRATSTTPHRKRRPFYGNVSFPNNFADVSSICACFESRLCCLISYWRVVKTLLRSLQV